MSINDVLMIVRRVPKRSNWLVGRYAPMDDGTFWIECEFDCDPRNVAKWFNRAGAMVIRCERIYQNPTGWNLYVKLGDNNG